MSDPVIDVHHHWLPSPERLAEAEHRGLEFWRGVPDNSVRGPMSVFSAPEFHSKALKLEAMDRAGVDAAVLSSNAGLHATMDACRWLNEGLASFISDAPQGRFFGMAHVDATHPEAGKEIERAVRALGFRAVFLPSIVDRKPLDTPVLDPVWETAEQLGVPVVVHPSHVPPRYEMLDDHYETPPYYHRMFGREFDVATDIVRLILGGVLDRFPGLRFVMPHCGGGIAAIMERVDGTTRLLRARGWKSRLQRPDVSSYLDHFYVDAAGSFGGLGMVRCALTLFDPRQIVFGTDYPIAYNSGDGPAAMRNFRDGVTDILSPADRASFTGGAAATLFGVATAPAPR